MGIRHLCDEKIKDEEFQYFLDNLEMFQVTEKVDGSNLSFGLDNKGDFYVNRDKKDSRKFGNITIDNVHLLGWHFMRYFQAINYFHRTGAITMPKNSHYEAEIIDDPVTNVVPYDPNQIIILDTFGNDININKKITKPFGDSFPPWSIKINKPFKLDYKQIRSVVDSHDRPTALSKMKSLLLDIPSQYGEHNDDSWIEGLVFKHENLVYKLVNKDRFTVMNKFLHETRAKLSKPKPGINSVGGLFQEFKSEIAELYSMKELATSQRKRWIAKNPNWEESIITQDQVCYSKNLIAVTGIIKKYNDLICNLKTDYMETYKDQYIETKYGICHIDEYTHRKNISSFDYQKLRIKQIDDAIKNDKHQRIGIWALALG